MSARNLLEGTTPGTWTALESGDIWCGSDEHIVMPPGESAREIHANARLIAAAPDLAREVEALRKVAEAAVTFIAGEDAAIKLMEAQRIPLPDRLDSSALRAALSEWEASE